MVTIMKTYPNGYERGMYMAGNTRERILEVSLELFAQSGYLGTSMSDIAKQLGITKGALYKHYRSKQEILDRIVEHLVCI